MALKTVLTAEEVEELDEALRGHYVESQTGKWVLDALGVDQHPQVLGLRATLQKFQAAAGGTTDARRLKARLEEAARLQERFEGIDPDAARAAMERVARLDSGEGEQDARHISLEKHREVTTRAAQEAEAQLAERQQRIDELTGYIESRELDQRLVSGLTGKVLPGTEESVAVWLKSKFESRVEWVEQSGRRIPRPLFVTDLGEEVAVDTFVETWLRSDSASPFLPGSGNSGTGAKGDHGERGQRNPWRKDTLNLTEQGRIYRENPALAKQLKAAAGMG